VKKYKMQTPKKLQNANSKKRKKKKLKKPLNQRTFLIFIFYEKKLKIFFERK